MAVITQNRSLRNNFGSTPWGNAHVLHYTLTTDSKGAAVASDSTAPIASGDKVRLGVLPAGVTLADSLVVVSGAITGLAGSLGFEYVDGVDGESVPQDAEYFGSELTLSATARLRNDTKSAPVTLPKDAWLVLTASGTASAAGRADVLVTVISSGVA
ncbi:MAG: hypothetical protein Q4F13_02755 [Pseudomonadota bacterium]|nr:hypothetical protein [Pseudomonadota bacterium]